MFRNQVEQVFRNQVGQVFRNQVGQVFRNRVAFPFGLPVLWTWISTAFHNPLQHLMTRKCWRCI